MGAGSLFTLMTASMDVGTPARAQTINNGPMATFTGHLTAAGEAIKLIVNRRMGIHNNRRRHKVKSAEAHTSSRCCSVDVRRGGYQLRCRSCHLTMVPKVEVRHL
ncbi:hypothetical protein TNCV_1040781 [Trichonephila clavipes]|nr:hypothetical protein TNCV_1040781 [Trichonephila clavipes]